ncbi:MAG: glucose sorbosone dehydrogenase [Parcubacteria group bacterium]|nr:glucose sorbosone dehydrogenase [Parcubacteria group bacterium]
MSAKGGSASGGKKALLIIIISAAIILTGAYFFRQKIVVEVFTPTGPSGNIGVSSEEMAETEDIEIIVSDLQIPWEITFLPTGELLVTERPGNLLKIGQDRTVIKISGVEHVGEGGLQGLALHPDFVNNNLIYLYLTTKTKDGLINRVERYQLVGNSLENKTIIIDNIPGARFHDGGRIEFGPDDKLYITTGDAGQSDKAQDLDYLGGKILRLNADGSVPEDNPFGTEIYSYGHRNPQGLVWDRFDRLWITEHGRSGALSGLDELNLIEPGKNYGWPVVQGDEEEVEMISPRIHSGPDVTWAPAGAIFWNDSIFFAGLRGEALYEFSLASGELSSHFFQEFGRLRAVVLDNAGFMYLTTSNTDGRGTMRFNDDKIIKINPNIFR